MMHSQSPSVPTVTDMWQTVLGTISPDPKRGAEALQIQQEAATERLSP
jgi:hypothetical protein